MTGLPYNCRYLILQTINGWVVSENAGEGAVGKQWVAKEIEEIAQIIKHDQAQSEGES